MSMKRLRAMEEVEDVNMASCLYQLRCQWNEYFVLKVSMERVRAMEEVEDVNMACRRDPGLWQWDMWKCHPLKAAHVWPDICDPAAAAACAYGYDEAALRFYGSGPEAAWPSMENFRFTVRKSCSKKTQENPGDKFLHTTTTFCTLILLSIISSWVFFDSHILFNRISELRKIGYHGMDGTELGGARTIWRDAAIRAAERAAEMRAAARHFRPMLRSFTNDDDGVQPTTLSDRWFRNYCSTLLSKLVGDTIRGSAVSVLEHGGITDIEDGLRYFVGGPNVYHDLRGGASSSRTTNTAGTLMGDGRRHDQDPRMKEFRNYAFWITSLSITILVGLLSANKRQPDLLFRSCSSLASGASICGIAMLMLVLIRPSSQSALTCLKTMQYLTIGLLFVAAVLVFTLL